MSTIDTFIESSDNSKSKRSEGEAQTLLPSFKDALGIREMPADVDEAALDFLIDVVLPIRWYSNKIKTALRQRWAYIFACILLTILIPVAVIQIPKIFDSKTAQGILGQFSVILSGILALQKTLAGSMSAQQRYGAWRKASSELKKIWYGFETQWRKVDLNTQKDDFVKDLQTKRQQAQGILEDEEDDYFTKLTLPSGDFLDLLSKNRQPELSALAAPLLPDAAQAAAFDKAKQALAKNTALIAELDKAITEAQKAVDKAPDPEKKNALTAAVAALQQRRDKEAAARFDLQAELAAAKLAG
jgi:hypothetical protein